MINIELLIGIGIWVVLEVLLFCGVMPSLLTFGDGKEKDAIEGFGEFCAVNFLYGLFVILFWAIFKLIQHLFSPFSLLGILSVISVIGLVFGGKLFLYNKFIKKVNK